MGARCAVLATVAVLAVGCGGDDEPAASTLPSAPDTIKLSSPEFKDGEAIPAALTCDGEGKAPTLVWREAPAGEAVETVLIVEDPDAPDGAFYHWTAYGMSAATGGRRRCSKLRGAVARGTFTGTYERR